MDFLSYCPTLIDILQYFDYTDIPNCKLVNRRMDDIIQQNSLSMPRPEEILLTMRVEKEQTFRYVDLVVCKNFHRVFLTDGRTLLLTSPRSTLNYYRKNGTTLNMNADSPDAKIIEKIQERERISDELLAKCVSYRNNSLEDGLRTLLSVLFRRFYFTRITLRNFPDEWHPLFLDEFRRNRLRCRRLFASTMTHALLQLVKHLGCREVYIFIQDDIRSIIREVIHWNKPITLQLWLRNFVKDTHTLLQSLMNGLLTLEKVVLKLSSSFSMVSEMDIPIRSDSSDPATHLVEQLIDDAKENWKELQKQWRNRNFSKRIETEKNGDSSSLCIIYTHVYPNKISVLIKRL